MELIPGVFQPAVPCEEVLFSTTCHTWYGKTAHIVRQRNGNSCIVRGTMKELQILSKYGLTVKVVFCESGSRRSKRVSVPMLAALHTLWLDRTVVSESEDELDAAAIAMQEGLCDLKLSNDIRTMPTSECMKIMKFVFREVNGLQTIL